jgi:hypothetical protein
MTHEQMKTVLDRVLTWPKEQQEAAAEALLLIEARQGESYTPDEEEWAATRGGLAEAERGDFAASEEMEAVRKRFGA